MSFQFPAERVEQLEAELKEVRAAFEEYIQSSKELEDGLDKELSDLRTYNYVKLDNIKTTCFLSNVRYPSSPLEYTKQTISSPLPRLQMRSLKRNSRIWNLCSTN